MGGGGIRQPGGHEKNPVKTGPRLSGRKLWLEKKGGQTSHQKGKKKGGKRTNKMLG